jgi:hypothetical protein
MAVKRTIVTFLLFRLQYYLQLDVVGKPTAGRQGVERKQEHTNKRKSIKKKVALIPGNDDRPFCMQQCLLGLAYGGDLDERCPNLRDRRGDARTSDHHFSHPRSHN